MTSRIAVVGSINTDFVVRAARFPAPGETIIGESFAIYGGGKGANQAIAAARLGASVEFFGAVGRDPESLARVAQLDVDRVGTSHLLRVDGFGGVALIQVERASGQNAITVIPGANGRVSSSYIRDTFEPWCSDGDLICLQLEIPLESIERALSLRRSRRVTTVLNAAPFHPKAKGFLPLVDYLIVNEIEAGQLLGSTPVELRDAAQAGARLRELGVARAVILTLGSAGAWLSDGQDDQHIAAPVVPVVDTTGAGDAFAGAFCALLARGEPARAAAAAAVQAGSLAVQKPGAQPSLPMLDELQQASDRR